MEILIENGNFDKKKRDFDQNGSFEQKWKF